MTSDREGAGLPFFIIIGTMKAGTTSLYQYLTKHPEICMSVKKETNFFAEEVNYHKGLQWYQSLFKDTSKVCGEASPAYSKAHLYRDVPRRIHKIVPAVRLIYSLRDPIERIISHYLHNKIAGREKRDLDVALSVRAHQNNYIKTSMYHFQVSAFLEFFSLDQILILTSEELKENRAEVLRRVFQFVGVDPDFKHSFFNKLYHRTPPVPRPVLTEEIRVRLTEQLTPDIDRLRAVTGLRFEHWCL